MKASKYRYIIGIDTGVNTGLAIWDREHQRLTYVGKERIHCAFDLVKQYHQKEGRCFVRVEDARKRRWFGKAGREQLQGAGSIKRDAKIWEDFLTDLQIPFELVAPKNNKTKLTADLFKRITGWQGRTDEHARDAAMLVVNTA